jgi:hypothetical protein
MSELQQIHVYLLIIPFAIVKDKSQFVKHAYGKLPPHVVRLAVNIVIVEKAVYNCNGGRPKAAAPLAKLLGYLIDNEEIFVRRES